MDNKSIIDVFQDVGEQIVLIDSDYKQTIEKLLDWKFHFTDIISGE